MRKTHVLVAVDVGVQRHRVAVGVPGQRLACEFDLDHTPEGFAAFFRAVEAHTQGGGPPGGRGHGGLQWPRPAPGPTSVGAGLAPVQRQQPEAGALPRRSFRARPRAIPSTPARGWSCSPCARSCPWPRTCSGRWPGCRKLTRSSSGSRRRRVLVEKVRVVNRMQADLHAICPGLTEITGAVDNLPALSDVPGYPPEAGAGADAEPDENPRDRRQVRRPHPRVAGACPVCPGGGLRGPDDRGRRPPDPGAAGADRRPGGDVCPDRRRLRAGRPHRLDPWFRPDLQRRAGWRDRHAGTLPHRGQPGPLRRDGLSFSTVRPTLSRPCPAPGQPSRQGGPDDRLGAPHRTGDGVQG